MICNDLHMCLLSDPRTLGITSAEGYYPIHTYGTLIHGSHSLSQWDILACHRTKNLTHPAVLSSLFGSLLRS